MTTLDTGTTALTADARDEPFGDAELAAAGFLARYSDRTLDAYRHDLRTSFSGPPTISLWC